MFALVDANSFYCSAEQVFRPDWRGKPMVVLSNNDGCVVAANRQAKEAGVEKFRAYFEMRALCEARGVIACSSNYELYGDLSAKMMEVIGRFAPDQHVYSIDESFLSFERCHHAIPDLLEHAKDIRRTVWKECRLPVCVGIGPTLTLSKVANHAAKKVRGYQGVCVIDEVKQRESILSQMKTSDVWGIGSRIAKRLQFMGIDTALQLSRMKPGIARKEFNVEIERTIRELNGERCKFWDEARADKKQIFSTRSVGERIIDPVSLGQALCKHADIAASKLRRQGSLVQVMMVFASNSPYDERPVGFKQVHRFAYPTDNTTLITKAVSGLVDALFTEGVRYYKLGVGFIAMTSAKHAQGDLFNESPSNPALMKVFDSINQKYGSHSMFLAAQGIEQKWAMRRELLSPQYTTRWGDLPRVRCG
ncbi:Y-family DNA polymerase [Photobacterium galatheae]|uniref:XRE family transcriptional regulator n=1 Tax=Photobacterium galatheae TaxID=1654360 RepID=A0A066RR87_9GAMM|nr:Y-family DNA polymerase [Photobacterium galatheae]KDM92879.1 XRE family transcriptional regulator [Photobacterium galatheae]MCM0148156.1 Y-family DNA polymerase [Photobacterium galatheae]